MWSMPWNAYDSANRLIEVSDQLSVTSLSYNGLGQRLSMDAAGIIAHYAASRVFQQIAFSKLTSLPGSCKLPAWILTSTSIVMKSAFRRIRW